MQTAKYEEKEIKNQLKDEKCAFKCNEREVYPAVAALCATAPAMQRNAHFLAVCAL